jgi:hypothetical protein
MYNFVIAFRFAKLLLIFARGCISLVLKIFRTVYLRNSNYYIKICFAVALNMVMS